MTSRFARTLIAVGLLLAGMHGAHVCADGYEPFVGQMVWVPYNFAPRGWAFCDGQLLSISQNTALFSLLGTTYGGDGRTSFALPDLRGKLLIGPGQGPGLADYQLGETGGSPTHTLLESEIPVHSHALQATTATADQTTPTARLLAQAAAGKLYGTTPTATMAASALDSTGGGQAHNNLMPYGTLNCIIALQGVFPSRP